MITVVGLAFVAIFAFTLGALIRIDHKKAVALDRLALRMLDDHWADMGRYLASPPSWAVPEKSVGINTDFSQNEEG